MKKEFNLTKEQLDKIMEWCYRNNSVKFKKSNLKLVVLDGGYVNVLELKSFLEGLK